MSFLILTSYPAQSFSQNVEQQGTDRETLPQSDSTTVSAATTEGRVYDEGQVQLPAEGQVENIPQGHVEAISPAAVQPPSEQPQPDLFRFETRMFNPIPLD